MKFLWSYCVSTLENGIWSSLNLCAQAVTTHIWFRINELLALRGESCVRFGTDKYLLDKVWRESKTENWAVSLENRGNDEPRGILGLQGFTMAKLGGGFNENNEVALFTEVHQEGIKML